ncbi:MAG: exo-alpha-sialidase [Bryobacterales bacterium]|nr:exo-alpha-sialidase [Bryobacterales bacterium]
MTAITRRALLAAAASPPEIRGEVFLRSPRKGAAVMAYAYYTSAKGGGMMSIEQRWSRSDTIDVAYVRRSNDYGQTWSAPVEEPTGERRENGMWRKHPRGGWVDPSTGRFIELWMEGVLPTDDPLEGLRQWKLFYRVNGQTRQVIHEGGDASHWLPGIETGKNSAMLGDQTCQPLSYKGEILLPLSVSPRAADGSLYNPGGGYTYHDAAVLHGKWRGDELRWKLGGMVKGDPQRTTRGLPEPTLARLSRGRILMVMRGSNDRKPELPSYRWVSTSGDGGWTWTQPEPWTYSDGEKILSPSSCSQLLTHSNGRIYWLGNLARENPKGNRPRYPFHIGEVDGETGRLRRASVRVIDDLRPGENPQLTLSNFYAREDRQTREVCLHMTRLFALPDGWEGDAMLYRIAV